MGFAFKRSVRQLITIIGSGFVAYATFEGSRQMKLFDAWDGGDFVLPLAAGVGAFVLAWFVIGRIVAGNAAR